MPLLIESPFDFNVGSDLNRVGSELVYSYNVFDQPDENNSRMIVIALENTIGVQVLNADVKVVGVFQRGSSDVELSSAVNLIHMGGGRYQAPISWALSPEYGYNVLITAPDHAFYDRRQMQLGFGRDNTIRLFFNNYEKLCNDDEYQLNKGLSNLFGDKWDDCKFNADRLIEVFGNTTTYSIPASNPNLLESIDYNNLLSFPSPKILPNQTITSSHENYREAAYKKIIEDLAYSNALLQTSIWSPVSYASVDLLVESYNLNDALYNGLNSISNVVKFSSSIISELIPEVTVALMAVHGTTDLSKIGSKNWLHGAMVYYVYSTTMEDYLDRLSSLSAGMQGSEKEIFKSALQEVKSDFNRRRVLSKNELIRAIRAEKSVEDIIDVVFESLATAGLKTALTAASLKMSSILSTPAGGTTAAVTAKTIAVKTIALVGFKVVVAAAIIDFVSAASRGSQIEHNLMYIALMDREIFGRVPDNYVSTLNDPVAIQNAILRIQLGLIYNQIRAQYYAGDHRTWIGRQWGNSLPSALTQNQALSERFVHVSELKIEKAEKDIEQYIDKLINFIAPAQRTERREMVLNVCDVWSVSNSGGVEGTIDTWDISIIPENAYIDIDYNTYIIPDRIFMYYPDNVEVLDTGWRGNPSYAGPRYQGGIAGSGRDTKYGVFRKYKYDQFTVEVRGVDAGTEWQYRVRCRENS